MMTQGDDESTMTPPDERPRAVVLLSTAGSEDEAAQIASTLVERRIVACVNLVPGVRSFYRWKGEICDDRECLLIIKTTDAKVPELRKALREIHSYDLPELIALTVNGGDSEYLDWVIAESR